MRRRSLLLTLLILVVTVGLVAAGLYTLARREPAFYTAAVRDTSGPDSTADVGLVVTRVTELREDLRVGRPQWQAAFTATELNALFAELLDPGRDLSDSLPPGITAPRVAIDDDRILVGVRVQAGPGRVASDATTTVLSIELRPWLVKGEPNVVAVEVVGVWAGGLPVSSQRYLDRFADAMRGANVDVTWYRTNGNPVALMKLYADQPRPPTVVRTLTVADGKVTVGGQAAAGP